MNEKHITYYFDSNTYNKIQIMENLYKECETQYFGKEAKINIQLNEFGTYVATLVFVPKESKVMQIIKNKNKRINKKKGIDQIKHKKQSSYLKQTERKYGMYKQTGTFRPI